MNLSSVIARAAVAVVPSTSLAITLAASLPRLAGQVVVEDDLGAVEGIPGVVSLSDGTRLRGRVSFTEGKKLRVYDVHARRVQELELAAIDAIRTLVESEKLEEAWAFKEEGSREKVKLGWTYPIRTYRQEVQLRGGQVIEGHCHAAVLYVEVYVDDGATERRVILPRRGKGKRGQALENLVYPLSIQLGERPGRTTVGAAKERAAPFASLEGRVPGLTAVTLVSLATGKGYPGTVAKDGAFRVAGLLPGKHAVFLRSGRQVSFGLDPRLELGPADLASIRARIEGLAELFDERRIVQTAGSRERPWVLLELRRDGGTTLTGEGGRSYSFRRWEAWLLSREGSGWKIESRVFLDRAAFPPGAEVPAFEHKTEPRLAVELKAGANRLPDP